jgi:predicted DsbA family dithiol-disulfide isomerase
MAPLQVEIWSDVVCPWCYIGKRRFEKALANFPHADEVEVHFRAFELDPSAPPVQEGRSAERLAEKYGMSVEEAEARQAEVAALGAAEGLEMDYANARSGNTFDAHRLIKLAADHGVQPEVKEAMMRAYFTEGQPIGDREALIRIAAGAGIPEGLARAVLVSGELTDEVREDEQLAAGFGIRGVPFFVLDRRYGVSGAQSPDHLLEALTRAWEEREQEPSPA